MNPSWWWPGVHVGSLDHTHIYARCSCGNLSTLCVSWITFIHFNTDFRFYWVSFKRITSPFIVQWMRMLSSIYVEDRKAIGSKGIWWKNYLHPNYLKHYSLLQQESEIENLEQAQSLSKAELNLANKRIRDLQEAVEREMMASSSDDDELSDIDSDAGSVSSRLSASRKRSVDRRSGHYDRSTRLKRRLTALEDEPRFHSLSRKSSAYDNESGLKHSRTNSRESFSGRSSSIDGYGMLSSRYLNGSLDSWSTFRVCCFSNSDWVEQFSTCNTTKNSLWH